MRPLVRVVTAVESQPWLDTPSYKLEHVIALAFNLLGDQSQRVRNFLHGTWLGHPLHPALTDVPVGAWTAAFVLDAADAMAPRTSGFRQAARMSIGVGLAGAAGAAVTGLTDWQHTHDNARRSGLVHGVLNAVAMGLYAVSWRDRGRGRYRRGRRLGGLGYALVLLSSYVGGSLVSRHRIGVDHADRRLEPRDFVTALPDAELHEGEPRRADVDGVAVLLVRSAGALYALGEQCAHLGGPMSEGWVYRDSIVCPWHGSRYDLATGRNVTGPATAPLPCFDTRVVDGQIQVRCRPPVPGATPGSVLAREQGHARAGH